MQKKTKVLYTFSPLRGRAHFEVICAKAQALCDEFPEIGVSCKTHSDSEFNTIKVFGEVDVERENEFLERIAALNKIV